MSSILTIRNLNVYNNRTSRIKILSSINLEIESSEILALVGVSGSGKSTLARTILGLLKGPYWEKSGSIFWGGRNFIDFNNDQMSGIRGSEIGMIFQEPMVFLNPTMKMGKQMTEILICKMGYKNDDAYRQAESLLKDFGIKDVDLFMNSYPHQLSGGMAQRGMIAMAAINKPRLLIADEPTSAVDAINCTSIINCLKELRNRFGAAVLFITHDLKLAADIADRVAIMDRGEILEIGRTAHVLSNPECSVTKKLISSTVQSQDNKWEDKYNSIKISPILEMVDVQKSYNHKGINIKPVDRITLTIHQGEIFGIQGESGCGKSTMAKILVKLVKHDSGKILLNGMEIDKIRDYPEHIQMIFQNPQASLDPMMKVKDSIMEGILLSRGLSRALRDKVVHELLQKVGLELEFAERYPHELSGGQRQRVGIARALAMKPKILLCDEPTSYLDTVSQAQILKLLITLNKEEGLTCIFISHDYDVLASICHRIAFMESGRITKVIVDKHKT